LVHSRLHPSCVRPILPAQFISVTTTTTSSISTTSSMSATGMQDTSAESENDDSDIMRLVSAVLALCCCVFGMWCCMREKQEETQTYTTPAYVPKQKSSNDLTSDGGDSELEGAISIVKVFTDLKLKIIRLIQRAERMKAVPGKERTYQELTYQIERKQGKLISMLEEKYQDKKRIQKFKPYLEKIWEEARQGKAVPRQAFSTRPSIQARNFFQYFDYENNGTMSLMEFAPVAQLVDPALQMDNISLLFDFMKGDAADMFENWHVEDFFDSSWEGGLEKFKLDLIRYMNEHTAAQAKEALSNFYASNKKRIPQTNTWTDVEMTDLGVHPSARFPMVSNVPSQFEHASIDVRQHNAVSMATSQSSENTHTTKPIESPSNLAGRHLMLMKSDSGTTISTYNPERNHRFSAESAMTTSTASTVSAFVKGTSNEHFNHQLFNFETDQEKTLADLYADIELLEEPSPRGM